MSRITVSNLVKKFGDAVAVDGVSFSVEEGELAVLLGPSGCGKSTILRLIAGLEQPTSGSICIGDNDVTQMPVAERAIAMVFQSYALFPHLNVAENIVFGLKVRGVQRDARNSRLHRVAELMGLSQLLARKPGQLSGGQRQRVALARAVVADRSVCLMDEPLSNLDAQLRHAMRVEIRELQQKLGITMIYVTHDQTEAMTMADSVILLRSGRIEQIGRPEALYDQPATTFAAKFIGAPPMNLVADEQPQEPLRGVRPEHVKMVSARDCPVSPAGIASMGAVTSMEYLGSETIISARLSTSDSTVSARAQGHVQFSIGEPVWLQWDKANEHHFDRASGERLSR